ncbi:sigma-54-dependent Fis family transcriptional regulator [Aurantiacibacter xanthus]|uniref:Sigma-54-dependent Fis family transcriptional regulator n=2 Tax=Aurantiacibacter xanthus TaxID=1784712 RepID=A0A3A1P4F7_9SPHN|nr:sigma-54-dependent Fis family transcriptional regulator [Aurantiacibacter xanthus]
MVCDADEAQAAGAASIAVARADLAIMQDMSQGGAFVYDNPSGELALAGLIARIAAHGTRTPISADPHSLSVFALADRLAQTDVPALLTGPTGAGKEVLARFIHDSSPRSDKAFIAVNCAAIPETMLEAMLFGHQKGAFTGASAGGNGLFREADGGTLLLDEIAEMPIGLQAKLLRALQEGEVLPVGATRPVKVDVRIVACANRDLPTEVAEGRFREDLFYRLNVFPIHLAPLRERPGDIAPLACAMLLRHANPERGPRRIGTGALALLALHNWPGNVRELENVMRRALVMAGGCEEIGPEHIVFDAPARISAVSAAPINDDSQDDPRLSNIVKLSEARAIMDTLKECNGKRIEAARRLGISERTLRYRLASYRDAGMDMGAVS